MINMGMNVMIVDELLNMRKIIKGLLRNLGFVNIDEAHDGSVALSMLKEKSFGLVISEWDIPTMNGLELLKAIRSDDDLNGLRFILITAEAKQEKIIEALKSGANNYILKPFTEEILQKKLEEVFN
jgi:two-component system chemotaxis response regulator CheY